MIIYYNNYYFYLYFKIFYIKSNLIIEINIFLTRSMKI